MGAHSRVSRSRSTMRRIAGGGALGVVAVGSVVGGTGVAQAEQTVGSHGVTVTVPDSCDVYLQAGLAATLPDSSHTQRCLAEKGLSPAVTDVSTTPMSGGSSSTTTSSSDGSSTTTTTTSGDAPSASSTTPSSTPSSTPASTPVKTESGATSDDPDDEPAAPGETKSVPIG